MPTSLSLFDWLRREIKFRLPSKNRLRTAVTPTLTDKEVESWAESFDCFFVLGLGRSGTTFLAHLLNQLGGVSCRHEPDYEDYRAYPEAFHSEEKARHYIFDYRCKEIRSRVARDPNPQKYGEVNSFLRRHQPALEDCFPKATFVHLVRDGRDVVRSMMSKKAFTGFDPHTRDIRPKPDSHFSEEWSEMDRFEKLAWYWAVENKFLRERVSRAVRFEDLLDGYDSFCSGLLEPLGLEASEELWSEHVGRPRNKTENHAISKWTEWSDGRRARFQRIAGEELKAYSYEW